MKDKIIVDIEVSDCTECPYYYGMIRDGWIYNYGKCEKTGGVGKNRNLAMNCPYKKTTKTIEEYIETDHHHYWKLRLADYIDDIIHERIDRIFRE